MAVCVTILHRSALLENSVPMNPNQNQLESQKPTIVLEIDHREQRSPATRMEPSEFESLLQRAMEILSARAQSAAPSSI
jgi:hypothetical protein